MSEIQPRYKFPTYLKTIHERRQLIKAEGTPGTDGLSCIPSPEQTVGTSTNEAKDYEMVEILALVQQAVKAH